MGSYESQLTVEQVLQERDEKKKAKLEAKQKKPRKSRATGYVNPKLIAALEYGAEKRRLEAEPASVRIARQQEADLQLAIKLCEEDNRRSAEQRRAKAVAAERKAERKRVARDRAAKCAAEKPAEIPYTYDVAWSKNVHAGDRFGLWTVLDPRPLDYKLECRCECGRTYWVMTHTLKSGTSTGCIHCHGGKKSPVRSL